MNYPNGQKRSIMSSQSSPLKNSYSNRGMTLEEDIHATNQFYLDQIYYHQSKKSHQFISKWTPLPAPNELF